MLSLLLMLLEVVLTGGSSPKYHANSRGTVSLVTATNVMFVSAANTVPLVWIDTAVMKREEREVGVYQHKGPEATQRTPNTAT